MSTLATLTAAGARLEVDPEFAATVKRLSAELSQNSDQPQAWSPLPVDWVEAVAHDVRSCWIFVLRSGSTFGAERHPNSHQRSVAIEGMATFELFEDGVWIPHEVRADLPGPQAISIPPGTWHRIQVGPDPFVSCSFHTVDAGELIEETPVDGDDLSVTQTRRYHAE